MQCVPFRRLLCLSKIHCLTRFYIQNTNKSEQVAKFIFKKFRCNTKNTKKPCLGISLREKRKAELKS
jgi:hypothetical protein